MKDNLAIWSHYLEWSINRYNIPPFQTLFMAYARAGKYDHRVFILKLHGFELTTFSLRDSSFNHQTRAPVFIHGDSFKRLETIQTNFKACYSILRSVLFSPQRRFNFGPHRHLNYAFGYLRVVALIYLNRLTLNDYLLRTSYESCSDIVLCLIPIFST